MKISKLTKTLSFALLFPTLLLANPVPSKYEKERVIKKNFNVSAAALLKVDNAYGNLSITSWKENRIEMVITIKADGYSEDKVIEKIEGVDIQFMNSKDLVSAKTIFNNQRNGWSWNWGNNNVNLSVHYSIKMPVTNAVDLENDYGSILIDRLDGHAKIECDYGRIDIGSLNGENNELHFDYTSKSSIGYIRSGSIDADYSGMTIEKAGNLSLETDYSSITVNDMEDLDYNADYGSIEIGKAHHVRGVGDYIGVKLGVLHGEVSLDSDYGSIKIEQMAANAGNLNINSNYTGVKIGYHPSYHFQFEIDTKYAGVSGKDYFDLSISKEKSSERYYKGNYGNPNAKNQVRVTSKYGGVSFIRK